MGLLLHRSTGLSAMQSIKTARLQIIYQSQQVQSLNPRAVPEAHLRDNTWNCRVIAPFQDIFTKWARHRERSQRSRVRVECANRIPEIFAIYPVCVRADSLQLGIVEPDVAATWTTIHNDRTEPHQL